MHDVQNDLPLLLDSLKTGKVEKLVGNFYDEKKYIIVGWNVKQSNGLLFKKDYKVIKLNKALGQSHTLIMNRDLRKKQKCFRKNIFWVDEQYPVSKNYWSVRKHRHTKTSNNRSKN